MSKQQLLDVADAVGSVIALFAFVAFLVYALPDQMSAEYDRAAAETEAFEAAHPEVQEASIRLAEGEAS